MSGTILTRILARLTAMGWPTATGQTTKANSVPVTLASDDDLLTRIGQVQASPTANTVLDRLKALLTGISLAAGEAHVGEIGQNLTYVGVEVVRPADGGTPTYSAKDVVADSASAATLITFTNIGRINGGSGFITKARLMTDQKTCTSKFRLHLFHTAPTVINDNSPYLLLYANADKRIGHVDFPAMTTEDSSNSTAASALNELVRLAFKLASGSRAIYGVLETLDAFTQADSQKFYVELTVLNN